MFLSRDKKNIDTFWLKKAPYQELCISYNKVSDKITYTNSAAPDQTALSEAVIRVFTVFHSTKQLQHLSKKKKKIWNKDGPILKGKQC